MSIPKEWQVPKRTEVEMEEIHKQFNETLYSEFGYNGDEVCTCENCSEKYICSCAYDTYNIGNDCLMEK
jgi:hypothetical protein